MEAASGLHRRSKNHKFQNISPFAYNFPGFYSPFQTVYSIINLCTMLEVDRNLLVLNQQCVGTSSPRLLSTMMENLGSETYKCFTEAPSAPVQGPFTPCYTQRLCRRLILKNRVGESEFSQLRFIPLWDLRSQMCVRSWQNTDYLITHPLNVFTKCTQRLASLLYRYQEYIQGHRRE